MTTAGRIAGALLGALLASGCGVPPQPEPVPLDRGSRPATQDSNPSGR
jgi:hypothetical protein